MPIRNALVRSLCSLSLSPFTALRLYISWGVMPISIAIVLIFGVISSLFYSWHRLSLHFCARTERIGKKYLYSNGANNVILCDGFKLNSQLYANSFYFIYSFGCFSHSVNSTCSTISFLACFAWRWCDLAIERLNKKKMLHVSVRRAFKSQNVPFFPSPLNKLSNESNGGNAAMSRARMTDT